MLRCQSAGCTLLEARAAARLGTAQCPRLFLHPSQTTLGLLQLRIFAGHHKWLPLVAETGTQLRRQPQRLAAAESRRQSLNQRTSKCLAGSAQQRQQQRQRCRQVRVLLAAATAHWGRERHVVWQQESGSGHGGCRRQEKGLLQLQQGNELLPALPSAEQQPAVDHPNSSSC